MDKYADHPRCGTCKRFGRRAQWCNWHGSVSAKFYCSHHSAFEADATDAFEAARPAQDKEWEKKRQKRINEAFQKVYEAYDILEDLRMPGGSE